MKKQIMLFVTVLILIMLVTACTSSDPSSDQKLCVDESVLTYSSTEEALKDIKAVKAGKMGKRSTKRLYDDANIYEKDHIYVLKEMPLPDYKQAGILIGDVGIGITYEISTDTYYSSAEFWWQSGNDKEARIEKLSKDFSRLNQRLYQYKDTKYYFVEKYDDYDEFDDISIYWWENGDEYTFIYPASTKIPPEDLIDQLEVTRYDF